MPDAAIDVIVVNYDLLPWAAGFYEGEGCIQGYCRKAYSDYQMAWAKKKKAQS